MNFFKIGCVATQTLDLGGIPNDMWCRTTWRQSYPHTAHEDTQTIFLRMPAIISQDTLQNDISATFCKDVLDELCHRCPPVANALLYILEQATEMLKSQRSMRKLGRVMLVKLEAGGSVLPHIDEGKYAAHYHRAHLPLKSEPEAVLTCNGETRHLPVGELWGFDHQKLHSAVNGSNKDRVHLIVDYA